MIEIGSRVKVHKWFGSVQNPFEGCEGIVLFKPGEDTPYQDIYNNQCYLVRLENPPEYWSGNEFLPCNGKELIEL